MNFILLSLWKWRQALRQFMGTDVGAAVHSEEEKKLLLAFESMARSYEVFQSAESCIERSAYDAMTFDRIPLTI